MAQPEIRGFVTNLKVRNRKEANRTNTADPALRSARIQRPDLIQQEEKRIVSTQLDTVRQRTALRPPGRHAARAGNKQDEDVMGRTGRTRARSRDAQQQGQCQPDFT
eukprot:1836743-Pleurochrysis_carterae.AAC.2